MTDRIVNHNILEIYDTVVTKIVIIAENSRCKFGEWLISFAIYCRVEWIYFPIYFGET